MTSKFTSLCVNQIVSSLFLWTSSMVDLTYLFFTFWHRTNYVNHLILSQGYFFPSVICHQRTISFRVEKYRPKQLDDLISHKDIINTSECFILHSDLFLFFQIKNLYRPCVNFNFHGTCSFCLSQSADLWKKIVYRTYSSMDHPVREKRVPYLLLQNRFTPQRNSIQWCLR